MTKEQLAARVDALIDAYSRNRQHHVTRIIVDVELPLLRRLCVCDPDGTLHYRGFRIEPTPEQVQRDIELTHERAEAHEQAGACSRP